MKVVYLYCLFLCAPLVLLGQDPAGRGTIRGHIFDQEQKTAIEYANAVLYHSADSSLVTGAITDQQGKFTIKTIPDGNYYLKVNFVGYKSKTAKEISIAPGNRNHDVGSISLMPAITELDEIEIREMQEAVYQEVNKTVVNAEQSIIAAGGTAAEVLETVPSVSVDVNGNLTLRGSAFFTVFIDGKPTMMQGMDALRQIPAGSIDQIEIISSPSAKYDPDGDAGIINVILKKNRGDGFAGIVNASIANRDKYAADALFNYNASKFNLFAGLNLSYQNILLIKDDRTTTLFENGKKQVKAETDGSYQRKNADAKLGFDYFFNEKNVLSVTSNFGYQGLGRGYDQTVNFTSDMSDVPFNAVNQNDATRDADFFQVIGSYTKSFARKGHKIDLLTTFASQKTTDYDNFSEFLLNGSQGRTVRGDPNIYRTDEDWEGNHTRIQLDYTLPFKISKLEAGWQFRTEREDRTFLFADSSNSDWTEGFPRQNASNFRRDIMAGYANYSTKVNKFSIEAGLRSEYTNRRIDVATSNEPFIFDQLNWFPSASINHPVGEKSTINIAYNRRINRSPNYYLDPFITISNRYSFWQGNPGLVPEISDNFELSYMTKIGTSSLTFDLFHRVTHDHFARVQDFFDIENNITYFRFDNLINRENTGLDINFSTGIGKWLRTMGNFETGYSLLSGDFSAESGLNESSGRSFAAERRYWYNEGKINSILMLPKGWRGQVLVVYIGGQDFIQGYMPTILFASMAVKKGFMKNKLSATLSFNDVFGSFIHILERESTYQDFPQFTSRYLHQREPQVLKLALTFNFNKFKKSSRRSTEEGLGPSLEEDF